MSKIENQTLVPELRFPEFIEQEGWKPKKLEEVCYLQAGKFVKAANIKSEKDENLYPCYGGNGLRGFTESFTHNGNYSLIGRQGALCGNINFASGTFHATEHAVVVKPKKAVSNSWLYYELCRLNLNRFATGQAQPGLSVDNLYKVDTYVPVVGKEQQKIADCLSTIDDLITANTQKLESLKLYKQGLIQKLFPAEGKSLPELRFSEFKEHWEIKKLNALAHYENGKAHENDIVESGRYIVVNSKFISSDGQVKKYTNNASLIASKDDILMVLSDVPNGRAIAKCLYVKEDNIYTVNQRICKLRSKGVNSQFLFYQLNRNAYFLGFDDGVKQTNLKKDDVLRCPLFIPNSAKEQKKIADCLSSLDELIDLQSKKNEVLTEYKKGLIQGLFPNFKGCEK